MPVVPLQLVVLGLSWPWTLLRIGKNSTHYISGEPMIKAKSIVPTVPRSVYTAQARSPRKDAATRQAAARASSQRSVGNGSRRIWVPYAATALDGWTPGVLPPPPRPLRHGWWLPTAPPVGRLNCSAPQHTHNVVALSSGPSGRGYGQANNQLLVLAHALEYISVRHPHPTLLLPPWLETILYSFDVVGAVSGWACISTDRARLQKVARVLPVDQIFYLGQHPVMGEAFVRTVLAHILLRPRASLRDRVTSRINELGIQTARPKELPIYHAVHLRFLPPHVWYPEFANCTDATTSEEISEMQPAYVERALKANAHGRYSPSTPILLMDDGTLNVRPHKNRLAKLLGVYRFSDLAPHDVWVDVLVMIHSAYFIGSPASTLSQNVMRVRDYMLGEENSARRANMHGCTRTPGQGPPELAEEDRMIVTDAR